MRWDKGMGRVVIWISPSSICLSLRIHAPLYFLLTTFTTFTRKSFFFLSFLPPFSFFLFISKRTPWARRYRPPVEEKTGSGCEELFFRYIKYVCMHQKHVRTLSITHTARIHRLGGGLEEERYLLNEPRVSR